MNHDAPLTAALLRSLLTNGSVLPCSPVRIEVDGKTAELVDFRMVCKATPVDSNGMTKPAAVPVVVMVVRTRPPHPE